MIIGFSTAPLKQVPYRESQACPGPSSEIPPSQLLRKLASSVPGLGLTPATLLARSWTPCLEGASS